MPIDKAINQAPDADIVVFEEDAAPEIEIVLDEDGGAIVEIGEQEAKEVDFYANLAEVIEPEALARIAIDVSAMFEADKGSRSDWEQMYAKGLDLLGLRMEERTKPFRGAAGAAHPMLQESIIQFQAQAFRELMPAGGPVRTQILGKETVDKFLADDVYIPYNGSSVVSQCPRLTHRLAMDSNEFRKRVVAGEYLDVAVDLEPTPADPSQIQAAIDKVVGVQPIRCCKRPLFSSRHRLSVS